MTLSQLQNSLSALQDIVNLDLVPSFNDFSNNSTLFSQLINTQISLTQNLSLLIASVSDQVIKGDQGIQGLNGDTGLQGIQGIQGLQGLQGLKGDQGIQGLKGDTGLQGIQGIQGLQGLQGLKGDQGLQGLPAPTEKYGTFTWSGTLPASGSAPVLSSVLVGNLSITGGNIVLPSGFAYDIEVRLSPTFTAVGVLQYYITLGGVNSRLFQVVPVENTAYTYPHDIGGRLQTAKLLADTSLNITFMTRTGVTVVNACDIIVRSIYA